MRAAVRSVSSELSAVSSREAILQVMRTSAHNRFGHRFWYAVSCPLGTTIRQVLRSLAIQSTNESKGNTMNNLIYIVGLVVVVLVVLSFLGLR